MATYIETLSGDVRKVLEGLRADQGEFSLAMLYNDGLSETGWNLIIASGWSDKLGRADAIKVITQALSGGLGLENKRAISRITVLPTSDPFVREITALYPVPAPEAAPSIYDTSATGIPGTAFIFYSQSNR